MKWIHQQPKKERQRETFVRERLRERRERRQKEANRRSSSRCWFFETFRGGLFFFWFFPENHWTFLLLFTRYVPASISRSFIFTNIFFERRTVDCNNKLLRNVLVRSIRARAKNSFVRVASSLARFRETFANTLDGRRINIMRGRKKKRFWRQCTILNPMTAWWFEPKAYTSRSEKIFSVTRSHRARFVRDFPRVTLASWCRAAREMNRETEVEKSSSH